MLFNSISSRVTAPEKAKVLQEIMDVNLVPSI